MAGIFPFKMDFIVSVLYLLHSCLMVNPWRVADSLFFQTFYGSRNSSLERLRNQSWLHSLHGDKVVFELLHMCRTSCLVYRNLSHILSYLIFTATFNVGLLTDEKNSHIEVTKLEAQNILVEKLKLECISSINALSPSLQGLFTFNSSSYHLKKWYSIVIHM